MSDVTIIIPTKSARNLAACISVLRDMEPDLPIVVVDDGVNWAEYKELYTTRPGFHPAAGSQRVPGLKPFIYARACNQGIRVAAPNHVVLLNDDALLQVEGGFTLLRNAWDSDQRFGAIGAALDTCGTPEQIHKAGRALCEVQIMLVFAAVFIPRPTIDLVGLLDERFCLGADGIGPRGYGCEDDDYSWRVRQAGLKLGVHHKCIVNHTLLPSAYRTQPGFDFRKAVLLHEEIFQKKWGMHPRMPIDFKTGKRVHHAQ